MKKSILRQGEFLEVGEALVSDNEQYSLVYQKDGNFELLDKQKTILWESATKNQEAWRTYLEDGKLVVYRFASSPVWNLDVNKGGDSLSLEDDGTLVLKDNENLRQVIHSLLQSKSVAMPMSSFTSSQVDKYPLDFSLKDMEGNHLLPINDKLDNILILEVTNRSGKKVNLKKLNSDVADESNFHFKLDFRSGTFKDREFKLKANKEINLDNWNFEINKEDEVTNPENIFSVYLLCKSNLEIFNGEKLYFYFEQANASETQGARKTRVLFSCKALEYVENPQLIDVYTKEKHLNIVYQKGEKKLPVNMGFLDTNRVINDGETENSLRFHVKSRAKEYPFLLNTKASTAPVSTFILAFKASEQNGIGEVKNRALAKKDMLNQITVQIQNKEGNVISSSEEEEKANTWIITKNNQGSVPFWNISYSSSGHTVNENGQFDFEEMVIVIDSILTDEASGNTEMTLNYKNFPGYWDGSFNRQIELTPISIHNQRIGIGTNTPLTALEVKGTIKSTRIEDSHGEVLPSRSIIMWYGDEKSIPSGWKVCNGEDDTPDLRDRFVVGAGRQYLDGDQGGKQEVTLTEDEMPKHQHQNELQVKDNPSNKSGYPSLSPTLENASQTIGGSQAHENRPPYHALYFIMKR